MTVRCKIEKKIISDSHLNSSGNISVDLFFGISLVRLININYIVILNNSLIFIYFHIKYR